MNTKLLTLILSLSLSTLILPTDSSDESCLPLPHEISTQQANWCLTLCKDNGLFELYDPMQATKTHSLNNTLLPSPNPERILAGLIGLGTMTTAVYLAHVLDKLIGITYHTAHRPLSTNPWALLPITLLYDWYIAPYSFGHFLSTFMGDTSAFDVRGVLLIYALSSFLPLISHLRSLNQALTNSKATTIGLMLLFFGIHFSYLKGINEQFEVTRGNVPSSLILPR